MWWGLPSFPSPCIHMITYPASKVNTQKSPYLDVIRLNKFQGGAFLLRPGYSVSASVLASALTLALFLADLASFSACFAAFSASFIW